MIPFWSPSKIAFSVARVPWALIPWLFLMCTTVSTAQTQEKACNPPSTLPKLEPLGNGPLMEVRGTLASFDPCHKSVELKLPSTFWGPKPDKKPPLFIIAHGGSGLSNYELKVAGDLQKLGYATLVYDAYQMNGFDQGPAVFTYAVTNSARQQMIFKVTHGAYVWATGLREVDTSRIFLQGHSNGGSVVLNMAAAVSPAHVKGVFAEGAPSTGIGLPDKPVVPIRLSYGRLDIYGGYSLQDLMYLRADECSKSATFSFSEFPAGSLSRCSREINPGAFSQSPQQWAQAQQSQGADIVMKIYDNSAHGVMGGGGIRRVERMDRGAKAYAWSGSEAGAASEMLKDIKTFVETH